MADHCYDQSQNNSPIIVVETDSINKDKHHHKNRRDLMIGYDRVNDNI